MNSAFGHGSAMSRMKSNTIGKEYVVIATAMLIALYVASQLL